jgi:hypothetical protein
MSKKGGRASLTEVPNFGGLEMSPYFLSSYICSSKVFKLNSYFKLLKFKISHKPLIKLFICA